MHGADAAGRLDQPGDAQAEIGAVDGDHHIRARIDHRLCGLGDAAFQVAVFGQHFHDAHDAQLGHVKAAGQPLRLHLGATDAVKGHVRHQRPQPCHQRAAQLVA